MSPSRWSTASETRLAEVRTLRTTHPTTMCCGRRSRWRLARRSASASRAAGAWSTAAVDVARCGRGPEASWQLSRSRATNASGTSRSPMLMPARTGPAVAWGLMTTGPATTGSMAPTHHPRLQPAKRCVQGRLIAAACSTAVGVVRCGRGRGASAPLCRTSAPCACGTAIMTQWTRPMPLCRWTVALTARAEVLTARTTQPTTTPWLVPPKPPRWRSAKRSASVCLAATAWSMAEWVASSGHGRTASARRRRAAAAPASAMMPSCRSTVVRTGPAAVRAPTTTPPPTTSVSPWRTRPHYRLARRVALRPRVAKVWSTARRAARFGHERRESAPPCHHPARPASGTSHSPRWMAAGTALAVAPTAPTTRHTTSPSTSTLRGPPWTLVGPSA
mmetsp:Transcript_47463/g.151456  ORF Transcript_47463/g.151456 Transcript_47463/m.151456 type:complete len:390 (+) Transcript_47463:2064-3233(+)